MVVLRPADARETVAAWKIAMEEQRPTALVLSRRISRTCRRSAAAVPKRRCQAVKGAYIVMDCEGKPDVILLASGSEVATLVDGAEKLKADGVKVRVVSVPSEGLFRDQSAEYQQSVLPRRGCPNSASLRACRNVGRVGRLRRRGVRSRPLRLFGSRRCVGR